MASLLPGWLLFKAIPVRRSFRVLSCVACIWLARYSGPFLVFLLIQQHHGAYGCDSGARQQIRYIFASTSHLVPPLVIVSHCVRPSAEYYPREIISAITRRRLDHPGDGLAYGPRSGLES